MPRIPTAGILTASQQSGALTTPAVAATLATLPTIASI